MAENRALKRDGNAPANIGERAMDNLEYIRETMERSAVFTSVPGYGGALMGLTAVGASFVAGGQTDSRMWLATWLAEALLAFAIGLLAMWQKSKLGNTPLRSGPAKKFALSFVPPLVIGIFLTFGLWRFGFYEAMVPMWLLCYGAAVVTGGAFSVRLIPLMGVMFMTLGGIGLIVPTGFGDVLMAAGFGIIHVVFGIIIGVRYGG